MLNVAIQPPTAEAGGLRAAWRGTLLARVATLVAILTAEDFAVEFLEHPWLRLHQLGASIAFAAAFLFFAWPRLRAMPPATIPISKAFLVLHGFVAGIWAVSQFVLWRSWSARGNASSIAVTVWLISIIALAPSLTIAFFPARRLAQLARSLIVPLSFATLTTLAAMGARNWTRSIWNAPGSRLGHAIQFATFSGVKLLLGLVYPAVISYPESRVLGTPRFTVQVAGACSGVEGLALMFVLTLGWLIYVRRELRMQRAAWLIPIALAAVWLLNLCRIAALIAIGDAGHPDVAVTGFHSQAGWLLFNLVAVGFLLSAQHLSWFQKDLRPLSSRSTPAISRPYPPVVYLAPFMAILAATVLSQAVTSGFEWLYPLRFAAAFLILWIFRAEYRKLNWRFGWLGPAAGAFVFLLWLGIAHLGGRSSHDSTLAVELGQLPSPQRIGWLIVRCLAAVTTVPIAEELAFRGFVARRVMAADFERVPFSYLTPLAIAVSAVTFGLLHGRMWIAGILAGIVFAVVAKTRGRIGDAMAAHATANLLLVAWAIASSDYSIW